MQLTFDNLKLCLLCTYFEATCKDYFEMCFNNGFVIEVLLFPKQFLIVLGLVSVTPEVLPLLLRKAEHLHLFEIQTVRKMLICKKVKLLFVSAFLHKVIHHYAISTDNL